MFKRILVPLDRSLRAERAIPVATRIARASGGSLVLLHAVSTATEFWPVLPAPQSLPQTAIAGDLEEAEQYLARLTQSSELKDIETETVALLGPVVSTILSVASSYQVDIIVLCGHGSAGMARWMMGSVTEKLARHASVPVFALRERGPIPAGPHLDASRPLRVLVPLDGSSHAEAALVPAACLISSLAYPAAGTLHLTRVVDLHKENQPIEQHRAIRRAGEYLCNTSERLCEEWKTVPEIASILPVTWSVAIGNDIARSILRVARNGEDAEGAGVFGGCDVVAIATHGYGGLQRWAMGSVTERVLNATSHPFLVVRPQNRASQSTSVEKKKVAIPQ